MYAPQLETTVDFQLFILEKRKESFRNCSILLNNDLELFV